MDEGEMKYTWILGMIVLCGCNTFRTTAIDRCENDRLVVNPDKPMQGVPVALRVPALAAVRAGRVRGRGRRGTAPAIESLVVP